MKNGALDFLTRPIDLDHLIQAISSTLAAEQSTVGNGAKLTSNQRLYSLSSRELEVFAHLIRGRGNRDISAALGVSLRTIKAHRAQIRRKLGVRSIAEFTKVAIDADFTTLPVVPAEYCGRGGNRRTPATSRSLA